MNIIKFKDNIRFLEVCVNRDGEMGGDKDHKYLVDLLKYIKSKR